MAGKTQKAFQALATRAKNVAGELEIVKKARAMDKRELRKLGIMAGGSAIAGGYGGYKLQEYVQGSDKIPDNLKAPLNIPLTTWAGGVGALVAAKKLRGTQAVVVSTALGGVAGGGLAYKLANGV